MKPRKLMTFAFASALVWMSLAVNPDAALASKTVIHGADCEGAYPIIKTYYSETPHSTGGIVNTSSEWRSVVCPLPRLNGVSGQITDIEVSVYATSASLWCSVILRDRFGGSGVSSGLQQANATGNRIIDFGNPNIGSYYEGSFHLVCGLPQGSRIASITIDQT